jgi:hypothetical protein
LPRRIYEPGIAAPRSRTLFANRPAVSRRKGGGEAISFPSRLVINYFPLRAMGEALVSVAAAVSEFDAVVPQLLSA